MKKPKIYLDTSIISYLHQLDASEKMKETLLLWKQIEKYDVYISFVTLREIKECLNPKQEIMLQYLSQIKYTLIEPNDTINDLANLIISLKVLTEKSKDDALHIASAIITACDYIVSWNFRHILSIQTRKGVRAISILKGYKEIELVQPTLLLDNDEYVYKDDEISPYFTVEDIHKIREKNYYITKDMTVSEQIDYYNNEIKAIKEKLQNK